MLGCGKSALVQAVSKKTNLPIIRVVPSILLRKYVGDSSHMTKAIFTAAKKIQPCIIFIDEMDALFRARSDHEISYHNRELMTECTYLRVSLFDHLFLLCFFVCAYFLFFAVACRSHDSFR